MNKVKSDFLKSCFKVFQFYRFHKKEWDSYAKFIDVFGCNFKQGRPCINFSRKFLDYNLAT